MWRGEIRVDVARRSRGAEFVTLTSVTIGEISGSYFRTGSTRCDLSTFLV